MVLPKVGQEFLCLYLTENFGALITRCLTRISRVGGGRLKEVSAAPLFLFSIFLEKLKQIYHLPCCQITNLVFEMPREITKFHSNIA